MATEGKPLEYVHCDKRRPQINNQKMDHGRRSWSKEKKKKNSWGSK